jgi:glycosyltransferase involved in cell wall biosynthesis
MYGVSFVRRGIGTLISPFQLWQGLRRHDSDAFDATFVYSTPITFHAIGGWLKERGARFIFNVQDLFPQNAIDLGILSNPVMIALYRWIEKRAYRLADIVTAHSEGNRAQLVAANPEVAGKVRLLHNWVDSDQFVVGQPKEDFRALYGLQGKFVAVYGGVIGPAQDLGVILDLAPRVADLKDLLFLIVGDGRDKSALETRTKDLTNVMFQPFVSRERYPSLLRSADVGFLTLSARTKTPVVPGKLLGYMAAGLPVLAFVNKESDAHALIAEAGCGYSCTPENLEAAERITRAIYARRGTGLEALGLSGRDYVARNFTKKTVIDEIVQLMRAKD